MRQKTLLRLLLASVLLTLCTLSTVLASDAPLIPLDHPRHDLLGESPVMQLVSVAWNKTPADAPSYAPAMSGDGHYIVFDSDATNLVPGDTNGQSDVFLHDRVTGQTFKISTAFDGGLADGGSYFPAISEDGRYIAFESRATNLVSGDTNNSSDVFVYDRTTGQVTRVSVASDGSQANGDSYLPAISSIGRYVAFESNATNLVAGDTNNYPDVFVHDRVTGQTTRVSVASDGSQADGPGYSPSISADGRYVAFESDAPNLVPDDMNDEWDVFVRDLVAGQTFRVSVASDGSEADGGSYAPSISGDACFVAFESDAANLVAGDTNMITDVFVRDWCTSQTFLVSVGGNGTPADGGSYSPSISSDSRYVAFWSFASNLVAGDTNGYFDIFMRDRHTGRLARVSLAPAGIQADNHSRYPNVSSAGRYIAFESDASNLVPEDANGVTDIFVYDRLLACPDAQEPAGVGVEDVQMFAGHWREANTTLDLDGDQLISVPDIMRVAASWGPCP